MQMTSSELDHNSVYRRHQECWKKPAQTSDKNKVSPLFVRIAEPPSSDSFRVAMTLRQRRGDRCSKLASTRSRREPKRSSENLDFGA